jgi:ribosomal protection tetracycline resistance protein
VAQSRLNLGIVAHVDAGKTTLTERLLYAAGVIDAVGSVDQGTTQTDSLALEQQRGITIRSAVVSFAIEDVAVNLIDTPGHPDFIAEVERVLNVLDGAVLVISAVEGVQPQTRLLMRALERLHIPTLLFVNKIDRAGAGYDRVLEAISERLTPAIVPLGVVDKLGTRAARFVPWSSDDNAFRTRLIETLAEQDEAILTAYVEEDGISPPRVRGALATQTKQAFLHPVFFGSAITGAGVEPLMAGIAELLPSAEGDSNGPVSGLVFKIERGPGGEKIAYVRMFSGTIRTRDRLRFGDHLEAKVTRISVFEGGDDKQAVSVTAGEIGKLWGLTEVQVGDAIGNPRFATTGHHFDPPTLETVVAPNNPDESARLRVALGQLAEQDPLINVRQDDTRHEISVSLYGEVQKEVIQSTLASDYGLDVTFRETTTICIERPIRSGDAVELLHAESNPFFASLGLRIDPAADDSGIDFRLQIDDRTIPLYLYKTAERFQESIGHYVRETMQEGLFGWRATDCVVTVTECKYSVPDGPPSRRGPLSTAADFRKLTPLVVMQALERAGTVVCEPVVRASVEIPTDTLRAVMSALGRLGAAVETPSLQGRLSTIEVLLPVARAQGLQRQLPGLTSGEGVLESSFAGYQPVSGEQPTRLRTTANPLNLGEYMMHLARRVS